MGQVVRESVCVCVYVCVQPHGTLCNHLDYRPLSLLCPWNFRSKNTGVGCYLLLQRIFSSQGSNPHLLRLLHGRQLLYRWATGQTHGPGGPILQKRLTEDGGDWTWPWSWPSESERRLSEPRIWHSLQEVTCLPGLPERPVKACGENWRDTDTQRALWARRAAGGPRPWYLPVLPAGLHCCPRAGVSALGQSFYLCLKSFPLQ